MHHFLGTYDWRREIYKNLFRPITIEPTSLFWLANCINIHTFFYLFVISGWGYAWHVPKGAIWEFTEKSKRVKAVNQHKGTKHSGFEGDMPRVQRKQSDETVRRLKFIVAIFIQLFFDLSILVKFLNSHRLKWDRLQSSIQKFNVLMEYRVLCCPTWSS